MDYNKLIEETKSKINNYSFDDELLSGIYDKAKERLNNSYNEGIRAVNREYQASRQKAIGDNALATKSLQQELATRGLALSGESAMLSLNQSMALRNTIADLARAAIKSKADLVSGYNKELTELEGEQAKLKASAVEKDKAALNDRLVHLENLQADKEKWQADYSLELLKENNRVEEAKAKLENENEKSESPSTESNREESGFIKVTPNVTPSQTANTIMAKCNVMINQYSDKPLIYSSYMQNKIRQELAREACVAGLSDEYLQSVIAVLVSHGFDGGFDLNIAGGKTLKWIYATYKENYDKICEALADTGAEKREIEEYASIKAKEKANEFIDRLKLSDYEKKTINSYIWF